MVNFFKPSSKKQTAGQVISVLIDRLDHNGIGVGKYQNKSIFIENTLPKEKVTVKITEAKGKYFKGSVIDRLVSSEKRIQAQCKHYKTCGGCDLQHLAFAEHLAFKQQKVLDLFSRNNITTTLPWQDNIVSEPYQYRRKARIGVQYNKLGEPIVGFRAKGTNTLTQLKECSVLVEPIKSIFTPLKRLIQSLSLSKSIGHVEVIYTQHISLVVRQLIPLNAKDTELWQQVAQQHQWQVYIDDGKTIYPLTNVTPLYYHIANQGTSINTEPKYSIYFEPKDFIQINHDVNQKMITQAVDWLALDKEDHVLDLFCGLGNFSLPIANQVKTLVGVEGLQAMVNKAQENAKVNQISNADFYQADLNSAWPAESWADKTYTKVLLDPARAGAYEAVKQLLQLNVSYILYISCDPSTLAKDSQLLIENNYKIEKISIMDMFAQTKHIETMVLFTKA